MRAVRIVSRPTWSWLLASSACLNQVAFTDARADSARFGLYAGVGVGQANANQYFFDPGGGMVRFPRDRTGWKLLAGIRPISWLGAEFDYTDAGPAHIGPSTQVSGLPTPNQLYGANGHVRAGTLFTVGYLPLHVSWMDVFGKVGFAHVWTSDSYAGNFPNTYYNCQTTCVPLGQVAVSESNQGNRLAYGGGLQLQFGRLSGRVEYERMYSRHSNTPYFASPTFASFAMTWKL